MSRKFLVISGKLKHGKDTFAKYMVDKIKKSNHVVKSIAFADPIKKAAKVMFPQITNEDLWGPSENRNNIVKNCKNPKTGEPLIVRDILQFIGKWGRSCNENCWVNATFDNIDKTFPKVDYKNSDCAIIISDGRFLNELEFSKKHDSKIIRIVRPDIISSSIDESETNLDYVSLKFYDYVVYNTSLKKLEEEAAKVVDIYILG